MLRAQRLLSAFGLALLLGAPAGTATARTELVTWTHVMPCSVDGFELWYGSSEEGVEQVRIDLELDPAAAERPRQAGNHFSYELDLPDGEDAYVCVKAKRGNETSVCSGVSHVTANADPRPVYEAAPTWDRRAYCEDFERSQASGWVDTFADGSPAPRQFGFFIDGDNPGYYTWGRDIYSHFIGNGAKDRPSSDWRDYEYSGRIYLGGSARVGVSLYSGYDQTTNHYRLAWNSLTPVFTLVRQPEGTVVNCSAVDTTKPPETPPLYWYVFRVQARSEAPGAKLQFKVWPAHEREPERFQFTCVDSAPPALSGTIGVWASEGGLKVWDDLVVTELPTGGLGPPGQPKYVP
jgi:hypothetical protein